MDRKTLYYQILNLGIKEKKIKNIDEKIDKIIEKYYCRDTLFSPYVNSKRRLGRLILENDFPTVEEWNDIAEQEGYLSHISLEYITGYNWKQLKKQITLEIKNILLQ